jgi:hypothetical protein
MVSAENPAALAVCGVNVFIEAWIKIGIAK